MIRLAGVSVVKSTRTILEDIDLSLSEQRIGIIGHNGCGKSTFARLLNGLEQPTTGSVTVSIPSNHPTRSSKKPRVGFVFQNPDNQIVFPLVEEDIAFGLKHAGIPKTEIDDLVVQGLQNFNLSHLYGRFTHELSGGEKQLLALIGVLLMSPNYIVLDEPTTLLDLRYRSMIIKQLRGLQQPLIIVSHDLDFMLEMDRVLLLHQGRVYADGAPKKVIASYRKLSSFDSHHKCTTLPYKQTH